MVTMFPEFEHFPYDIVHGKSYLQRFYTSIVTNLIVFIHLTRPIY